MGHSFEDVGISVDVAVTQVNYTLEGPEEEPIIHVFGRSAGEDAVHARVHGFDPYFYASTDSFDPEAVEQEDGLVSWETAERTSIRGDEVTKIIAETPRDVGRARDSFDHYEADVPFPNRFLVDKKIQGGVSLPLRVADDGSLDVHHTEVEPVDVHATPRVAFVDIEVDDRSGFPENGTEPIICITAHDSRHDQYALWLVDTGEPVPGQLDGYDPIDEDIDHGVRVFDTEEAMLDDFIDWVDEVDPDILSGWNFEDFDAPYLLDRLEVLDADAEADLAPERLSRVGEVWRDDWNGPNVKGRVVFDLLYAYKRTQFTELDSYRLDAIGEQELGVGKERYAGKIGDLWEQDPERLLEYNLRDVELCVELDRAEEIVPFWNEVQSFVGCKLEDSTTPGDAVDVYVLQNLTDGYALPTKGSHADEDYEGAAVFDPIVGIRENVATLDLKSLYPMCMVTLNASPETKVDPDSYEGETFVAPSGTHFKKEPDGAIRGMVDELLAEREEKKAIRDEHDPESDAYARYDRQQRAVKVIMNSLYGTLGWERFRLYDREMGEAVTAAGRSVIEYTADVAEDMGYEVIYGDTDSVLLEVDADDIIEAALDLEDEINESYDEFAADVMNAESHRFEIEFEKLYRRYLQAGKKKRYAGHIIWKEGKEVDDIDITGFEYQRSDVAPVTKRAQHEVIEMAVTGSDDEEIQRYLRDVVDQFESESLGLDEVAMPGGIGKGLGDYMVGRAHVRGAKYANLLLGTNFQSGSKPKRLYLRRVRPSFFARVEETPGFDVGKDALYTEFRSNPDVICFDYPDEVPDEFEVDWEKMMAKTLQSPIEGVIEAIDLTWDDVVDGEQTSIEAFGD